MNSDYEWSLEGEQKQDDWSMGDAEDTVLTKSAYDGMWLFRKNRDMEHTGV